MRACVCACVRVCVCACVRVRVRCPLVRGAPVDPAAPKKMSEVLLTAEGRPPRPPSYSPFFFFPAPINKKTRARLPAPVPPRKYTGPSRAGGAWKARPCFGRACASRGAGRQSPPRRRPPLRKSSPIRLFFSPFAGAGLACARSSPSPPAEMASTTVYVGNVEATVDEFTLQSIFENCGAVVGVRLAG